jgi:hypothetical protein
LGRNLLSRRRLHDLRHSSASIQIAEGVAIELLSKRHGHSSTAITGNLYVHLTRSAGQVAAEKVAAAVPRTKRGLGSHRVPKIENGRPGKSRKATMQVRSGGRGIRTHDEVAPIAVFKTAAIGH